MRIIPPLPGNTAFFRKSLFLSVFLILFILPGAISARTYSGLEVFLSRYTYLVRGKRVGLITNPTGVDSKLRAGVDLLIANRDVRLVALFAPEHGIRGDLKAGQQVPGERDKKTGLPVYTLYGAHGHRPPPASLRQVDVLIFDIQDVGSRAYTYVWHLAECMKAAAESGKTIIVLDRPNPYGAAVLDGPVTEREHLSFIGLYPVPRVYGMTVGELARYLNREERIGAKLYVIPMLRYSRGMSWKQTGLPWVPPSPHIPSPESAYCFAATGTIGELGFINIGIGYTFPFQAVAAPWINASHASSYMNSLGLPGVRFRPVHYTPYYAAYTGKTVHGLQLHITDPASFRPSTTEVAILCYLKKYYPRHFVIPPAKAASFDKAMGTSSVRRAIMAGWDYKKIASMWHRDLKVFQYKIKKYLIYR